MQVIPVSALPNQTFNIVLDGQYCTISLRWKQKRLYLDLDVDSIAVRRGAVCENRADILQSPTVLFRGSLHFWDNEGDTPPEWARLDSRYFLLYVSKDEDLPESLKR